MRWPARIRGVMAVVALLTITAACGSGKPKASSTSSTEPSTPKVTAGASPSSTTSSSTAPIKGLPAQFLGVTRDGRLAVISMSSGRVVRYLTVGEAGGGPGDLALSPDGSTVYFTRGLGTCAGEVDKVLVSGGPETPAVRRQAPSEGGAAVRPDGQLLAYSRYYCQPGDHPELVIASTRAGDLGSHVYPNLGYVAGAHSWSPDGTRLVMANPDDSGLTVLKVSTAGSITGQSTITPRSRGCLLEPGIFWTADDSILVTRVCGAQGPDRQDSILALDPSTGAIQHTVLTIPKGSEADTIALDPSGRYLLYETAQSIPADVVLPNEHPIPVPQAWILFDGHSTRFSFPGGYGFDGWLPR